MVPDGESPKDVERKTATEASENRHRMAHRAKPVAALTVYFVIYGHLLSTRQCHMARQDLRAQGSLRPASVGGQLI